MGEPFSGSCGCVAGDAKQVGKNIEGVAMRALGTSQAGGGTEEVAVRALGPLPSCLVVETVEVAADMVARPSTAVCMDGCASGTCVDGCARTFVPAAIIAAMAPAVANPYLNSAHGKVADTVRGFEGAVGGGDMCAHTPADTAGTTAEGVTPPTGGDVQGAHGHFTPHALTEGELHGADLQLQWLTTVDLRLLGIFGNTIHLNDGTHLDGGIGVAEYAAALPPRGLLLPATLGPPQRPMGSSFPDNTDQPLGRSHSALLELGATIDIPGSHPLPRPWNLPIS